MKGAASPIRVMVVDDSALDEESRVVWGMPGSVAKAGLAKEVLPLDQIAEHVVSCAKAPR